MLRYTDRTKVMLSIHVATISVQARRLDHVDKTIFLTDKDLRSPNVLLALQLLLCTCKFNVTLTFFTIVHASIAHGGRGTQGLLMHPP